MTDPRIKDSLVEIDTQWSIADVCKAHDILDAIDDAEARRQMKAEANRG